MRLFDTAEIRTSSFAAVPADARLRALNEQLSYAAARSPYYAEALRDDTSLPALSALARLPFLTADALRAQGRRLVCVSGAEIARVVSLRTSGTAGDAKRLYFTRGDVESLRSEIYS